MQLALRRHRGNLRAPSRVGRALLLCGGTAVAGFGSLAWSTTPAWPAGKVCAVGIGCNMLISVYLLRSGGQPQGKSSSGRSSPGLVTLPGANVMRSNPASIPAMRTRNQATPDTALDSGSERLAASRQTA